MIKMFCLSIAALSFSLSLQAMECNSLAGLNGYSHGKQLGQEAGVDLWQKQQSACQNVETIKRQIEQIKEKHTQIKTTRAECARKGFNEAIHKTISDKLRLCGESVQVR